MRKQSVSSAGCQILQAAEPPTSGFTELQDVGMCVKINLGAPTKERVVAYGNVALAESLILNYGSND